MSEKGSPFTTQFQILRTPSEKPFDNFVGKEENVGNQHILFFFPIMFLTTFKINFSLQDRFVPSSAMLPIWISTSIQISCMITLSQTSPGFTCLQYKSFENTGGKGEIPFNEQFLLFPQCFLSCWRTLCHFDQI